MRSTVSIIFVVFMLTACAGPMFVADRTEVVLPLNRAWVDGQIVEYVTTDISDPVMAGMMGSNYVPRLAEAIRSHPGQSLLERVYKFPNEEQISIFQSAPSPVGADNQDRNYSPLWRVVLVRWKNPAIARELRSEEALLAAHDNKDVALESTGIVVNCPVIRNSAGQKLRGVR